MIKITSQVKKSVAVLALVVAMCGNTAVYADNLVTHKFPVKESFEQYVNSQTMLTQQEKVSLINADNAKKPVYEKLNKVNSEIAEIERNILKDANPTFNKIYDIKKTHMKIVEKMNANQTVEQKNEKNYIKYIKLSKVLTNAEKTKLINDSNKISELYKEVGKYYAKVEVATKSLKLERENLQNELRVIDNPTEAIWEKIYK